MLVTGGSRGIGRAIVEALRGEGRPVAFTWCSAEGRAAALAAETGARAYRLDLADRGAPDPLVARVEADLGPLEGLVNNAGTRRDGLLAMTSDRDWDHVIDVDLGGVFRCCRAVLRGMISRRRGSIVNVSSLAALHGVAGQSAYAAAKAGILGLSRSLAREVGSRGVRVNSVVPGYVATDLTADLPDQAVRFLRSAEVLPAGTTPGSVASAAVFLLSDGASAITGQMLVVDAGTSA